MINMKIRWKNPVFIAQVILAILLPILAYMGLRMEDLTTWGTLGHMLLEGLSNPYVLGMVLISVWNAVNDPTTKGLADSENAQGYTKLGG